MSSSTYRFLPHTTDAYIEAQGETFERALENAALALFDTMCEVRAVSHRVSDRIQIKGRDEVSLLHDWLESLLLKFELEQMVYSKFQVSPISKSDDGLVTSGMISGEKFDRVKHSAKVEVKAVTYHRIEVARTTSMVTVRYILDL